MFSTFKDESEYYISVTEWLLNKRKEDESVIVDPIHAMIREIHDDVEITDLSCAMANGFSVRPDGVITGCASEIGGSNPHSFGNIYEQSMQEIMTSESRQKILGANDRLNKKCYVCRYINNCKGGCHQRARFWNANPNDDCHGLSIYLDYITNNLERLKPIMGNDYGSL